MEQACGITAVMGAPKGVFSFVARRQRRLSRILDF